MKKMLLLLLLVVHVVRAGAQLLSWSPPFPAEDDAAQTLVITVDASKGNDGLFNYANAGDVYIHTGVITNLSANSSDWKYSKFQWATTDAAAKATPLGGNKWSVTIAGSLRAYYGLTNTGETIKKSPSCFATATVR